MIYLASPFFNSEQLAQVQEVEGILQELAVEFYSPRLDGVLQDMTAEERKAQAPIIFQRNVDKIQECALLLALLDHKDTGTTWELGCAFALGKPIIGCTTSGAPMNVMLRQCMDAHAASLS